MFVLKKILYSLILFLSFLFLGNVYSGQVDETQNMEEFLRANLEVIGRTAFICLRDDSFPEKWHSDFYFKKLLQEMSCLKVLNVNTKVLIYEQSKKNAKYFYLFSSPNGFKFFVIYEKNSFNEVLSMVKKIITEK
ncbi:MAG: hypothetical protein ABIA74_02050 [bacterium]